MGKWINRVKEKNNEHTSKHGDRVDSVDKVDALAGMSTMSPLTSHVVNKKFCIDTCKTNELRNLVKKVSDYYGGDDEGFFEEYINDMLMKHSIDAALMCFRNLAAQLSSVNNRK